MGAIGTPSARCCRPFQCERAPGTTAGDSRRWRVRRCVATRAVRTPSSHAHIVLHLHPRHLLLLSACGTACGACGKARGENVRASHCEMGGGQGCGSAAVQLPGAPFRSGAPFCSYATNLRALSMSSDDTPVPTPVVGRAPHTAGLVSRRKPRPGDGQPRPRRHQGGRQRRR